MLMLRQCCAEVAEGLEGGICILVVIPLQRIVDANVRIGQGCCYLLAPLQQGIVLVLVQATHRSTEKESAQNVSREQMIHTDHLQVLPSFEHLVRDVDASQAVLFDERYHLALQL
jgi:hypothetical protein